MKKILIGLISALFVAVSVLAAACGSNGSFVAPGFKDFGETKQQSGFVCRTENYVLFINGAGASSGDNAYGAPVKGSLMAIKNADFVAGKFSEAKIIVPKLFAATDYTSGLFVQGDYVYYGTPSTDKNSSGNVASDEIVFMKSKIDGTEKPQELFKYSALSVSYRITGTADSVYIAYYDSSDTALKVYSTKTAKTEVIAKTDAKTNDSVGETGKFLSLGEYKFVDSENAGEAMLLYSVTVYDEKYYEDKAAKDGYTRSSANYNYIFAYKAGDTAETGVPFAGKKLLDGSEKGLTYTLKLIKNGYVFYSEKDVASNEKTFGIALKDAGDMTKAAEIKNSDLVADTTYIVSLDEVYAIDSDAKTVYKTSLKTDGRTERETVVLKNESLSSILFKNGDSLYFYNSDNNIVRVKLSDAEANTERVSLGATNSSWYKPQVITVDNKDYLLYCDATTIGSSYTYVADLSAKVIAEDTDEDEKDDLFYLDNVKFMGQMTEEDSANVVADAVNAIDSTLDIEEKDGKLVCEKYEKARKIYDELDESVKKFVGESYVTKLENCKKALELAEKYNALADHAKYDKMTDSEKASFKTAYETAKSARQSLIDKEGKETFETIRDMIPTKYKYFFQQAKKKIDG